MKKSELKNKISEALTPDEAAKVDAMYNKIYKNGMLKDNPLKLSKYDNPDAIGAGKSVKLVQKESKMLSESNKKAIEFVKDKLFKIFDKNGIKLKGYRIGGRDYSTLVLFPKTDRDFESISRSLQRTYKGNDAYSFKNQKPFEVAGKQYKIVYDINKMDGGINITPTTFDNVDEKKGDNTLTFVLVGVLALGLYLYYKKK